MTDWRYPKVCAHCERSFMPKPHVSGPSHWARIKCCSTRCSDGYRSRPTGPPEERFWQKVKKTDTCWIWMAAQQGLGYGCFWHDGRQVLTHRFVYEVEVGPIPDGLVIDHLCNNTLCVNPAHLKAVTQKENVHRSQGICALNALKTHCPEGHPYSGDNLYVTPRGGRGCRTCTNAASLRHYHRKKARAA